MNLLIQHSLATLHTIMMIIKIILILDNHFNHDDLIIIIISALDAFSAKRERQVGFPARSQGLSYFMIKIIISVITMMMK